jgi:CheY-like chemotaxis protein
MGRKVLLVEDYDDSRLFMKLMLEDRGYQVTEARDGIEAFDKFKQMHPDLILMDISLPQLDGLTATRAIRELEKGGEKVPIIAVTAFGKMYHQRAIEAGCNDLIDKPVDFDSLEAVIDQYIGH